MKGNNVFKNACVTYLKILQKRDYFTIPRYWKISPKVDLCIYLRVLFSKFVRITGWIYGILTRLEVDFGVSSVPLSPRTISMNSINRICKLAATKGRYNRLLGLWKCLSYRFAAQAPHNCTCANEMKIFVHSLQRHRDPLWHLQCNEWFSKPFFVLGVRPKSSSVLNLMVFGNHQLNKTHNSTSQASKPHNYRCLSKAVPKTSLDCKSFLDRPRQSFGKSCTYWCKL